MKHSVLDASGVASTEAGDRLTGRLTALLNPAPTDEKLWEVLASVSKALAEPKRDRRYDQTRRETHDIYRRERDRIRGLAHPAGQRHRPGHRAALVADRRVPGHRRSRAWAGAAVRRVRPATRRT